MTGPIPLHAGEPTIAACATATGGVVAVLRLSGPHACAVAACAGLVIPPAWRSVEAWWTLAQGRCPCRIIYARGPRSFTGFDLVEITIPGSRDLVDLALSNLRAAGAKDALPGAFARQALANGRINLVQAEAILAVTQASSAAAATLAIARLRGALAGEVEAVRLRLLHLRALVEAGLDFVDEAEVSAFQAKALQQELGVLRVTLERWAVAANDLEGEPRICLVGPANAGKSALFNRLIGSTAPHALVSSLPGTTRDWVDAPWLVAGRVVRLIDTAGWLEDVSFSPGGTEPTGPAEVDARAVAAGRISASGASLLIACSAPDAPLPQVHGLPLQRTLIVATKADLGGSEPRAEVAVSAENGTGCATLIEHIAERLGAVADGTPRQQRLLAEALQVLNRLELRLPGDELLAEDLRQAATALGELLGATTADEVLDAIFARFCIGK